MRTEERVIALLPHEVKIGANTFYIRRYAPFDALEILGDLQQRFAAPLLAALGKPGTKPANLSPNPLMPSEQDGGDVGGKDVLSVMLDGFAKISATLPGRDLVALAKRLIDPDRVAVSINGGEAVKLRHDMIEAAGMTPADIVALCVEIVRYNFVDFYSRFATPIGKAQSFLGRRQSEGSVPH